MRQTRAANGTSSATRPATASFGATVRDTRAGDRFHYVWAASRSLHLLDKRSRLQEIWIEGLDGPPAAGDEVIDVAELRGESPSTIDEISVLQLKYSVRRQTKTLGLSELGETFKKFAQLDNSADAFGGVGVGIPRRYVIVSNRPIWSALITAVDVISAGSTIRPNSIAHKLFQWIGLPANEAASICSRIEFEPRSPNLRALRSQLDADAGALSSGGFNSGVGSLIVEGVAQRASGEMEGPIRLSDILVAFGATEDELLPAPSELVRDTDVVDRESWSDLAETIVGSPVPLVVTAIGGVGKSTFVARLDALLQGRAEVVVYDCFGNGRYRSPANKRHRHRDGLVQIASELSARALCGPIIPRLGTEAAEYNKAFENRVRDAVAALRATDQSRSLVIAVDAADNAASAAAAYAEPAFVRDLLRLQSIDGVHLVLTSRPERLPLLDPPSTVNVVELETFSEDESAALLRRTFPEASDSAAFEFHRATYGNPRTQASTLEDHDRLEDALHALAGFPKQPGDALQALLSHRLDRLLDRSGPDRPVLDLLCTLIAKLRPRIPIAVLAELTGEPESFVRSFAADVGRSLLVDVSSLQFRDEPTETFFRDRFSANPRMDERIVELLTKLASKDSYAAASLPQMLWEFERYDELASLASSDLAIPDAGEIERRQIIQLRVEFALRAAITRRRPADIFDLAMIAGVSQASSDRRYELLRNHADLAGEMLDSVAIDDIRAGRLLPSDWTGDTLSAEALMMAMAPDRSAEAIGRLRGGVDALYAWARAPEGAQGGSIEPRNVADIVLTYVFSGRLDDAGAFLQISRLDTWTLRVARLVFRILLSRNRMDLVAELALRATKSGAVVIAAAAEMHRHGVRLREDLVSVAWRVVRSGAIDIDTGGYDPDSLEDTFFIGLTCIVASAVTSGSASTKDGSRIIRKYLPQSPPLGLGSRHGSTHMGLLLAYALASELTGSSLEPTELVAHDSAAPKHRSSADEERERLLGDVTPWLVQWARMSLERADPALTIELIGGYPSSNQGDDGRYFVRRIAAPLAALLARFSEADDVAHAFEHLLMNAVAHSGAYTAIEMIRSLHGDPRYARAALQAASDGAHSLVASDESSNELVDDLVRIARAISPYDAAEAGEYFGRAVAIATRVGYDAWERWGSTLAVAREAREPDDHAAFMLASHLGRCAEGLQPYLSDNFDEEALTTAVAAIAGSRVLALISKWRDKRFGNLDLQVGSLLEEHGSPLAEVPHLAAALTTFTSRASIGPFTKGLSERGALDATRVRIARELAWLRGSELTAHDVGDTIGHKYGLPAEAANGPSSESLSRSGSLQGDDISDSMEQRAAKLVQELDDLDLGDVDTMKRALSLIEAQSYASDLLPLVTSMSRRPVNMWPRVVAAFGSVETLTTSQLGAFLNSSSQLSSPSLAFKRSLRDLAKTYLSSNATAIAQGRSFSLSLDRLSELLELSAQGTLLTALESLDSSAAVESSESCYRLAAGVAPLLTGAEASRSLRRALVDLEASLELTPWEEGVVDAPVSQSTAFDVAAFLWSALADPRAATRWQAIHSVRFLLEYGDDHFDTALRETIQQGIPTGFVDRRFPFYGLHAVDSFLFAAERASISSPARLKSYDSTIGLLLSQNPDHVHIQRASAQIRSNLGARPADDSLGRPLAPKLLPLKFVSRFKRPQPPSPWGHHAIQSEFDFHFDLEEYWLAPLTSCFEVEHTEVITAASDIILDEWGWRGSPALETDPRREAANYATEETYFYKSDFPKADDLRYYLTYHATQVVAGRLARTKTPYQDPGETESEFERWMHDFDVIRDDRRWVADARRPVPSDAGMSVNVSGIDWRWAVSPEDFLTALGWRSEWITVWQSASNSYYSSSESIRVHSALVDPQTGAALIRSLQTAKSFRDFRIPLADDEEYTFNTGRFRLNGWLDLSHSEGGADRRDSFAEALKYPTARPSKAIQSALGLSDVGNGLEWASESEPQPELVSETWASKSGGRDRNGPDGYRTRVTKQLADRVCEVTGNALLFEVWIDRDDESSRRSVVFNDEEGSLGYLDDYVRYFLYTPQSGWVDYRGHYIPR